MKVALESAYDNTYLNVSDFETHVGKYLNALNKLTTTTITSSNYKPQFKLEMEKVHALRMIGQLDKSMDILTHLESCGLDQGEQEIVNLEKSFYDRDLLINHIGNGVIEYPTITNPSAIVTPVAYVGPYVFGATIQSFNNFIYPGCNDFKSLINENDPATFNVFPNPVNTELNVSFSNEFDEESLIEIMQLDGRLAYQSKIKISMSVPTTINVEKWDAGAYKIRVIHPDGTQQTATFVID